MLFSRWSAAIVILPRELSPQRIPVGWLGPRFFPNTNICRLDLKLVLSDLDMNETAPRNINANVTQYLHTIEKESQN